MRVLCPKTLIPALLISVGCLAPAVRAQPGANLPQAVVNAPNIGPEQQKAITDHIAKWIKDLDSAEAEKVKKAREALVAPLLEKNVSVPFRLEYGKLLADAKLGDFCKSKKDTTAINALRVAGEASEGGMLPLLKDGFKDSRLSVRYAAVFGALRTFEQIGPERLPAIPSGTLEAFVGDVAKVMNDAKEDATVVDAASRALLAAAKIESPRGWEIVGKRGATEVCAGLAKRVADAGVADRAMIDAGMRAAVQFQESLGGARGGQVDKDVRKEAAGLGGQLVAWVCRQIATGEVEQATKADPKAREAFETTLASGENLVLSAVKAKGETPPAAKLVPSFKQNTKAGDASALNAGAAMVAEILAPKFELSGDKFKLK